MGDTNIEWTDRVWNPIRGCSRVSAGCVHCYAEVMAARFARQWGTPEIVRPDGGWSGVLSLVESKLTEPLHWRAPQKVFVNSMSDLFHDAVPDEWIDRIFAVMALSPRHTFQVLTKRPERMARYATNPETPFRVAETEEFRSAAHRVRCDDDPNGSEAHHAQTAQLEAGVGNAGRWESGSPLPNVWLGVSVEDQATADARIPLLLQTPAAVRFVSYEPALGPVDFGLDKATCKCCPRWGGRWIRTKHRVVADFPSIGKPGHEAPPGIYRASSNPHGALCVPTPAGDLGVRPREFDVLGQPDWIIVGGESGPGARPFDVAWARSTIAQCRAASVPVFCKQLGSAPAVSGAEADPSHPTFKALEFGLRDRKGGDPSEWPEDLRVREFPEVRDA